MRVVLDTNVLIAAFIARGLCSKLLEHCVQHHAIVVSQPILDELRKHLAGKFKFSDADADAVDKLLRSQMEIVEPQSLPQPVCRDPDDDVVLATALSGRSDCIVTGDKDLLVLQRYENVAVVSPSQFSDFEAEWRPAGA